MGRQSKEIIVDDSNWPEVKFINSFSLFMGYLLMAVRGLSFLVLTWTTVVLLGGYVSALSKKDFWFLTVITLVQTAGVFNASLTQKLHYIGHSIDVFSGLMQIKIDKADAKIGKAVAAHQHNGTSTVREHLLALGYVLVACAAACVQMLMSVIILCPLAFLYVFGLYISAGLSLARLIQRDYGDQANEGHLRSALHVLYSLAVLQGAVFTYRYILRSGRQGLVNKVAKLYGLDDDKLGQASVWWYLVETKDGCAKDPSFIEERNLITYAVELMQSNNCPDKYLSGLRVLGSTLIKRDNELLKGQKTLIKQLIGSPSSSHLLLKLLHTLDPRSPYGTVMSRLHAARIVAHLAGEIRLSQFPGTIQCIASLLDACQHQQDDSDSSTASGEYSHLMAQGLLILGGLATDEGNCKIIVSTPDLLSKIMMPTASDLLHRIDHEDQWIGDMVNTSLTVISQLADAPGDTGKELRRKISDNKEAISSMETILRCQLCGTNQQSPVILAIKILKQLGNGSSSTMDTERTGNFLNRLSDIFIDENMDISIRKSAGEALLVYLQSKGNETVILESSDDVLRVLTTVLPDVSKDTSYRLVAAQILEHLPVHYPKDDEHLKKLKDSMINLMPKVLREILRCESTEMSGQTETEENNVNSLPPPADDIENQKNTPQGNVQSNSSSNRQQDEKKDEDRTLLAGLLSLCVVICDTFIAADQHLSLKLGEIAPGGSQFSFPRKLKEMVERHNQPTGSCLRIMKHTCKMITSMMKHNGWYDIGDMESLIQCLSDASKKMLGAESLMIMVSRDLAIEKPTDATLASLVKEAQELLGKKKAEETEMEASAS